MGPLITRPEPHPELWLTTCLAFHTSEAVLHNCQPSMPPPPRESWQSFPGWDVSSLYLCSNPLVTDFPLCACADPPVRAAVPRCSSAVDTSITFPSPLLLLRCWGRTWASCMLARPPPKAGCLSQGLDFKLKTVLLFLLPRLGKQRPMPPGQLFLFVLD